jgi:biotin carboxyl carrier protein
MRNFVVTIDGKSYNVGVEEVNGTASNTPVAPVATSAAAPVAASAAAKAPAKAAVAGTKVNSPFPGLIKNLLVAEGATVAKDQPILVLEAMKMDNEITAPCAGKVSFQVAKGANVESEAVLAVIS